MGIIIPDFQQPVWAEQWLVCKVVAHLCANLLEITTRVFWFFKITLHNSAVLVMFEWNVFVNRACVSLLRLLFTGWCFFSWRRVSIDAWSACLGMYLWWSRSGWGSGGMRYVNEGHRKYWSIVSQSRCENLRWSSSSVFIDISRKYSLLKHLYVQRAGGWSILLLINLVLLLLLFYWLKHRSVAFCGLIVSQAQLVEFWCNF